jgi:hypothetical protein
LCPGAQKPEAAVEHRSWITPGPAPAIGTPRRCRNARLQDGPWLIGHIHRETLRSGNGGYCTIYEIASNIDSGHTVAPPTGESSAPEMSFKYQNPEA